MLRALTLAVLVACGGPDAPSDAPTDDFDSDADVDAACLDVPDGEACPDDGLDCTDDVCMDGACTHPVRAAGTVCREVAGDCDVAETCDGTATACPADAFAPATAECRAADGACDVAETCSGDGPECPADAVAAAESVCREAAGDCDVAEVCDGTSTACPADAIAVADTVCRDVAGDCDVAEVCDGVSVDCPADAVVAADQVCRPSQGVCDRVETCDGVSAACPADAKLGPNDRVCRFAEGDCDVLEACDGVSDDCPPDGVLPVGTVCGPLQGYCDLEDTCDGVTKVCVDEVRPPDTVCTPAFDCQEEAYCTQGVCPPGEPRPAGTECRAARGSCDQPALCDGTALTCPDNERLPEGTVCRASTGPCDPAETCVSFSLDCPADVLAADDTECGPGADCQLPSVCQGGTCVDGNNRIAPFPCRPRDPDNPCDVAETCGPSSRPGWPDCPDEGFRPDGTSCVLDGTLGECLAGVCDPTLCRYDIQCPDGFACTDGTCSEAAPGDFGEVCVSDGTLNSSCSPGLICCASMFGDGEGGPPAVGDLGRCVECCQTSGNGDCGGGDAQCCDGRCESVNDPDHCGGCAYDSQGVDCDDLTNACNPVFVDCSFGVCIHERVCDGDEVCTMPPDPSCSDPFCLAQTVDPACLGPGPWPGCGQGCLQFIIDTSTPCSLENSTCESSADCCDGLTCKSNLSPGCVFCTAEATCQY